MQLNLRHFSEASLCHPPTVFPHYSCKYGPMRIMCKHRARWYLLVPTAAGHWHAPLSMTKRVPITLNGTVMHTQIYCCSALHSKYLFIFLSYKPCHLSCMFMRVNVYISTNTTFFSLRQCPCLKNTEKWHLISASPFNKVSLTRLNSSLYDFATRHFWRTLNILNILIFCIILKEVSCCF